MPMSELIYGRNPVFELLHASDGSVERVLIVGPTRDQRLEEIQKLARQRHIPIKQLNRVEMDQLLRNNKHQGVAAYVSVPGYVEVEDILEVAAQRNEPPLLALLDSIEDPHNLGAILRSADGAGLHGVIIPKNRAANVTATVAKTSAGAVAHIKTAQVTNLNRTIDSLKEKGIWFVGADQASEQDYTQADLTGPLGIVVGAEGRGLHRLLKERCDFLVKIPMYGKINSLNASVAAALLFFEARRQRQK